MWYLSRTPHSAATDGSQPADGDDLLIPRNTIFPISDTGIFHGISMIKLPKLQSNSDDHTCNHQWEWFACLSSPFLSVAVSRLPSFRIQLVSILDDRFLCAKLSMDPDPFAFLCTYVRSDDKWVDVPSMHCHDRNLMGSAAALLDGWLYLAGGFKGNPSDVEPSTYLKSAERLNLKTWEWQSLPDMQNPRAFAAGIAHKGRFYVVGGSETLKHAAEIYYPNSNSWKCLTSFVPEEADGFTAASYHNGLLVLTWSGRLGAKLWIWVESANPAVVSSCRLMCVLPFQPVERDALKRHGARLLKVGKEVWFVVNDSDRICQVDGMCAWPVFPAPIFRPPSDCHRIESKGYIHALSFSPGLRTNWRRVPVYSM